MAAFGISLSEPEGKAGLSEEELKLASQTVLLALEVSDVLLGMGDKSKQQQPVPNLSTLMLGEGVFGRFQRRQCP